MLQQKHIRVLACIILSGLLLGMPAYIMVQSSLFSSGDSDVIVNNIENIELDVDTSYYKVNMTEDEITSLDLTEYFPDYWSTVSVYAGDNFTYSLEGDNLNLEPAKDWNGFDTIYVRVGYGLITTHLSSDDPSEPDAAPGVTYLYSSFELYVLPVNDPPFELMTRDTAIHMSSQSTFDTGGLIDLNEYFSDPDSDLVFSCPNSNGYVYVIIVNNFIDYVISSSNIGTGSFEIIASDGEYDATYDFLIQVESRERISMLEDTPTEKDVSDYLMLYNDGYSLGGLDNIDADIILKRDSIATILNPNINWNGEEIMELYGHYIPYSFNPPVFPITVFSVTPDESSIKGIISSTAEEFGYFEFDVVVESVNDAPEMISEDNYRFTMSSDSNFDMAAPINLDSLFIDVDSDLTYSWSSNSDLVAPEIQGSYFNGIRSGSEAGDGTITIIAYDEEFVTTKDMSFIVEQKETLETLEDNSIVQSMESIFDPQNQNYDVEVSDHIVDVKNEE